MTPTDADHAPPWGSPSPDAHISLRTKIFCALLVAVPVALALAVPLYQRVEPTLGGLPFFYWFQMSMAVAAACGCGATYLIAFRNEDEGGES